MNGSIELSINTSYQTTNFRVTTRLTCLLFNPFMSFMNYEHLSHKYTVVLLHIILFLSWSLSNVTEPKVVLRQVHLGNMNRLL